ncbi:MAG TPA: peroxiredoxin [Frankiaceae bacterium]|jgi:peroxiredoxin|nr:peroxiredoxin [Frankiaceae bacterium]
MTLSAGDKIPDVEVRTMGEEGPVAVRTGDVLGKGKVVLFAVPGAFTPGCSRIHLPGFVQQAQAVTDKGVDTIACIAVNDAWVMDAWGKDQQVGDSIVMLADGNGDFTKAMGLVMDGAGIGLGMRSKRYAAIIDNGVITSLDVEQKPGVDVSSCSAVLSRL